VRLFTQLFDDVRHLSSDPNVFRGRESTRNPGFSVPASARRSGPLRRRQIGAGLPDGGITRIDAFGLVERADFASGTSSRSTKLIHGGLRYLRDRELGLVRESVRERERLMRMAPHLVQSLAFVVRIYAGEPDPLWKLRIGRAPYDWFAGPEKRIRRAIHGAWRAEPLPHLAQSGHHGLLAGKGRIPELGGDQRVHLARPLGVEEEWLRPHRVVVRFRRHRWPCVWPLLEHLRRPPRHVLFERRWPPFKEGQP
jgi:hypothetical protein